MSPPDPAGPELADRWPAGAATGVGSLPGEDFPDAVQLVFGELPEFPHLPELPARGPGADIVGRGLAHLVDLHFDLQPSGWRLVGRPGRDETRARDLVRSDLDTLEAFAAGWTGPVKVAVAGPWTLASTVELPRGDRALADPAAVRDLAASLAAGVRELLDELRRRLPGAAVVLQLDEPSLPAVLAGAVPTASGFGALAPVTEEEAVGPIAEAVAAASGAGAPCVVHGCAPRFPVRIAARAGAAAVSVDLTAGPTEEDEVGELLEGGGFLIAGVVPALEPAARFTPEAAAEPIRRLWHRLGLAPERLPGRVTVSPTCGLAGASPQWAREAMRIAKAAAGQLAEEPELQRVREGAE